MKFALPSEKFVVSAVLVSTALYFNTTGAAVLCGAHFTNYLLNTGINQLYNNQTISREQAQIASKAVNCLNCLTYHFYQPVFQESLQYYMSPELAKASSKSFTLAMAATHNSLFARANSFNNADLPSSSRTGLTTLISFSIKELIDLQHSQIGSLFQGTFDYYWKTKPKDFSAVALICSSTLKFSGYYLAKVVINSLEDHTNLHKTAIVYTSDIVRNVATGSVEKYLFDKVFTNQEVKSKVI